MNREINTLRLIMEIICLVALAEFVVLILLPRLAPGVDGLIEASLGAMMLSIAAGPIVLWRVRAVHRSTSGSEPRHRSKSGWHFKAGVLAIVVLGAASALAAAVNMHRSISEEARQRFNRLVEHQTRDVEDCINRIVYGLNGLRGVYVSSKSVEREECEAYVTSRNLPREFPGTIGIGVIKRVTRDNLDQFVAAERADSAPDFRVRSLADADVSVAESPDLYVVTACYPRSRNAASWGVDEGSDATRREAIELAVASGQPAITRKIQLLQDSGEHTGFLYLVPVYRNGTNPTTAEQRTRDLEVVVYAPMLLEEVLAGLDPDESRLTELEIFDGATTTTANLLSDRNSDLSKVKGDVGPDHDSKCIFSAQVPIRAANRTWTALFRSSPMFEASVDRWLAPATGVVGLLLALLTGTALWVSGSARQKAEALVVARTADLEAALLENKAFRAAVEAGCIISETDRDGRITFANDAFCAISGYRRDELLGSDHRLINSGVHPTRFWADAWRSISSGQPWRGEVCNRAKDGSLYWVDTTIAPMFERSGEVSGYISIRHDITDRIRSGEALAAGRARFEAILNAEPELICVIDAKGNLELMNPAGYLMLEVECEDDVRMQGVLSFVEQGHREALEMRCRNALRGVEGELNFEIGGACGTRRWMEARVVPLREERGAVTGIVIVARDVSARRAAEQAAALAHADAVQLAAAVDAHADAVFLTDTTGVITRVNPSFERLTGYTSSEIVGQPASRLKSGRTPVEAYQDLWSTVSRGSPWTGRICNRRKPKGGKRTPLLLFGHTNLDDQGDENEFW
ncbi:MAG: PAS domain S-box protein, partial [Bacteroidetes bacterium]|nr:PAS domain S-box protein [Bacteroidota bacterium]